MLKFVWISNNVQCSSLFSDVCDWLETLVRFLCFILVCFLFFCSGSRGVVVNTCIYRSPGAWLRWVRTRNLKFQISLPYSKHCLLLPGTYTIKCDVFCFFMASCNQLNGWKQENYVDNCDIWLPWRSIYSCVSLGYSLTAVRSTSAFLLLSLRRYGLYLCGVMTRMVAGRQNSGFVYVFFCKYFCVD